MSTTLSTPSAASPARPRVSHNPPQQEIGRPAGRFYRPELDALRFFAFFAVFLGHGVEVNPTSGVFHTHPHFARTINFLHHAGGFGLSLFFFLSSFLITTLLMLEHDRTGTVHLRNFYIRRILRIWPLYLGFLTVAYLVGRVWSPAAFSLHALVAYFTLSANWYIIATGTVCSSVQFLWSISVEEQFYLVWPLVLRTLTRRKLFIFCLVLIAASLTGTGMLAAFHSSGLNIWFSSTAETLFFACGGLLALFIGLEQQSASWWRCLTGIAVCILCWLLADATGLFDTPYAAVSPARALTFYILVAIGTASLVWGFLHAPRKLIRPQLIYLGRISFGLYVFHGMALLVCAQLLAPRLRGGLWLLPAISMTFCLAALSYEFFEKPFLKLKYHFEVVHSRPVDAVPGTTFAATAK